VPALRGSAAREQDDVKLVLDGRRELVHERGRNRYERTNLARAEAARAYARHDRVLEWRACETLGSRR
jgi:hypothetical protein